MRQLWPPRPRRREPAGTEIRAVDDVPVVFQYGQPVPAFEVRADVPGEREYLDVDGQWLFDFDPGDAGVRDGWMSADFDDGRWQAVEVPLPWDLYGTAGFGSYDGSGYGTGTAFRDGCGWYRTRFRAPVGWSGRFVKLCFLGVNYAAGIYLNGTLLGEHEGGHTPFAVDATAAVRPGAANVLAVRVYRRPWYRQGVSGPAAVSSRTELPHKPVDYWPYAGITRSVFAEVTAPVTVSKVLTDARDGRLAVSAVVFNHGGGPARRTLVLDPGEGTGGTAASQDVTVAPGEVRVVRAELAVPAARPWSPDDPALYRLTARLTGGAGGDADELVVRYGMRSVEVAGGRLRLNGEPVLLKGLNWHEETPERGRAMRRKDYDQVLETVADLGANFLRNSGYTRHPDFYRAADERGVLVCDEADNFWVESSQQRVQCRYGLSAALVAAMVWNQVNHPSVVLWSLHNESETGDRAVYRRWITDLRSAATSVDPQRRPVTWASNTSWDPAFDLADVIGFNEYFGYFYGDDADLGRTLDTVHGQYPGSPILITENGSYADLGRHGGPDETGTEEWQAEKLRRHWSQVAQRAGPPAGYAAGYTYWLLKDYKERMNYNHHYNGISAMGLLTFDGQRRAAYEAFRDSRFPPP